MLINSPSDIEVSDIFKINLYEYFIVTSIEDDEVNGIIRDKIYNVGQQDNETYNADLIVSRVNEDDGWSYWGNFSYDGKDINGNPI